MNQSTISLAIVSFCLDCLAVHVHVLKIGRLGLCCGNFLAESIQFVCEM